MKPKQWMSNSGIQKAVIQEGPYTIYKSQKACESAEGEPCYLIPDGVVLNESSFKDGLFSVDPAKVAEKSQKKSDENKKIDDIKKGKTASSLDELKSSYTKLLDHLGFGD